MKTYTLEHEHFNVEVEEIGDETLLVNIYFKGVLAEYMIHKNLVIQPEELDSYITTLHKKCVIMAIVVSFDERYSFEYCNEYMDAIGEDDYEALADKLMEVL